MGLEDRKARRAAIVRNILNRHDPAGLIAMGCPEDEYAPEINGVLTAVEQAGDERNLTDRLHRLFNTQFGDADAGGTVDQMAAIATELWKVSRTQRW